MQRPRKLVAVSGGFDRLHVGHTRLFGAARSLGDSLLVIVNNDNWLRKKKGYVEMPEAERVEVIRALRTVDEVVLTRHIPNDHDTSVCHILEEIRPAIFANGGDRKEDNIPEVDLCQRLSIEMIFNVGEGGKMQSSSWLMEHAAREMRTTRKPWGWFENHHSSSGVHLKTLHLNAEGVLSLQRHKHRGETWILVSGEAEAVAGPNPHELETTALENGRPFYVPMGCWHRLQSKKGAVIVEISDGVFDENDIVRIDDSYGRI